MHKYEIEEKEGGKLNVISQSMNEIEIANEHIMWQLMYFAFTIDTTGRGSESSSIDEKEIKEYIDMVITELKKKPEIRRLNLML